MRVVLGGSSFGKDGGGIAAYNRTFCEILASLGHEVLVFSADSRLPKMWEFSNGSKVRTIALGVPTNLTDQQHLARQLFEEAVRFDPHALVSSNHIWLTSLFPCFASRRVRLTVSHFYNGILAEDAALGPDATDWIVAISEVGRDWLIANTDAEVDQVPVIYNTVTDFAFEADVIQRKCSDSILRIVYPGGGAAHKSPDVVFRIIGRLQRQELKWKLIWLGRDNFVSRFIPSSCLNRVELTGLVTRREAERHIRNAHCLLLPSRGEGCPMTLIEGMRSGTIPLVSDCPSAMREIVKHGVSGFVSPQNSARSFFENIVKLGKSRILRQALMIGARTTYERELAANIWAERMLDVLSRTRPKRSSLGRYDHYDPLMLKYWRRERGTWRKPTANFIRDRFNFYKHACRCSLSSIQLKYSARASLSRG